MKIYCIRKSFHRFFLRSLAVFFVLIMANPLLWAQYRPGVYFQEQSNQGSQEDIENTDDLKNLNSLRAGQNLNNGLDALSLTSYQVHVLGEVKKPGTYRLSTSMRVTDALSRAFGLKTSGSERFVQLRKQGEKKGRVLDLFAYKTYGDLSQNPYLQDNDAIYVPLKNTVVEIQGPVKRPGIFELKSEKNIQDIIRLAGGFTVGMNPKDPIKVIRYRGYEDKKIFDVENSEATMENFKVEDGDVVVIPHKFLSQTKFDYNLKKLPNDNIYYPTSESRVFVIGAVRLPGAFEFNQNYSLRQYLTLAGGTTTMAKSKQIKVVSLEGKALKAKNGNYGGTINPGDTIVVPEKSIPTSFYIGLLPTIASLGLSAFAIIDSR